MQEYGREQVKMWRNGFRAAHRRSMPLIAPSCSRPSVRTPAADALPNSESLHDTMKRTVPFWMECVLPELEARRNVLISAHAHSIRSPLSTSTASATTTSRVSRFRTASSSMPSRGPHATAPTGALARSPQPAECGVSRRPKRALRPTQSRLGGLGLDCPLPPPLERPIPRGKGGEGGRMR